MYILSYGNYSHFIRILLISTSYLSLTQYMWSIQSLLRDDRDNAIRTSNAPENIMDVIVLKIRISTI